MGQRECFPLWKDLDVSRRSSRSFTWDEVRTIKSVI